MAATQMKVTNKIYSQKSSVTTAERYVISKTVTAPNK